MARIRELKRMLPLLLAAVLLSGCGSRVQPSVDITGKYYYLPVHVEYGRGSSTTALHRFNVETGSLTPLCPDPLCSHELGECSFSGLINYCADNDVIWFDSHNRDDDGEVVSICRYHVDSGKLDVLHTYRESGFTYMFRFGYLWRISSLTQDDGIDETRISLTHCNFDDPEVVSYEKIPFAEGNGRYYYAEYSRNHGPALKIYSSDRDFCDEVLVKDGIFADSMQYYGGYVYYRDADKTLYRVSADEEISGKPVGKTEKVKESLAAYFFYWDKLYYLQYGEREVIGWDEFLEEEITDSLGSKIWRAEPDGKRAKIFAEAPEYVFSTFGLTSAQVGGRLVLRYGHWEDRETDEGIKRCWRAGEGGLLVVDLTYGTYAGYDIFDTHEEE